MYSNLKAEMARRGLTSKDLALKIEMPFTTLYKKLRGDNDFCLKETKKIIQELGKDEQGNDYTCEYLFNTTEQ